MTIQFNCPRCGRAFETRAEVIGRQMICSCGEKLQVSSAMPPAVASSLTRPASQLHSSLSWLLVGVVCFAVGVVSGLGIAVGTKAGLDREEELTDEIAELRRQATDSEIKIQQQLSVKDAAITDLQTQLSLSRHPGTGISLEYLKSMYKQMRFETKQEKPDYIVGGQMDDESVWIVACGNPQNFHLVIVMVGDQETVNSDARTLRVLGRLVRACSLADQSWKPEEIVQWLNEFGESSPSMVRPTGNGVTFSPKILGIFIGHSTTDAELNRALEDEGKKYLDQLRTAPGS